MTEDIALTVSVVVARAPEWIRTDLAGKDVAARARAEDALSAMIAAALAEQPIAERPSKQRAASTPAN